MIATEQEAWEFLSGVMRGEPEAAGGREIPIGDRLKACTGLLKIFEDRRAVEPAGERELAIARASENIGSSAAPAFAGVLGDLLVHGHTHYDLAGGRGSMKSSFVSLAVVLLLLLHPDCHAMVLRKVANTLRDSVYAQYVWALEKLGVRDCFDCRLSPLELVFRPTGQKILFRGADDPMKIKSVKVPFGYLGITHFEEKDQFSGRGEIRTILQSTMRGGGQFWNFESYNPTTGRISTRSVSALTACCTAAPIWTPRPSGWGRSFCGRRRRCGRRMSAPGGMSTSARPPAPAATSLRGSKSGRSARRSENASTGSIWVWTGASRRTPSPSSGCTTTRRGRPSICSTSL